MKSFKVGSVVLATEQGLGYLAKAFYDNGLIDKVFVHAHSSRVNHYEWYGDNRVDRIDDLLDCDVLIFFEEVFDWKLIVRAREKGVKTILMPMYECTRSPLPYFPDLILSPSLLDQKYYPDSTLVTVPVDVEWRKRLTAKTFVHNSGNGGLGGRNGTKELLEAMEYVKSPIKLIIRSQVPISIINDDRIEFRVGTFDDIWSEGDVFVFPEKFNGLSLPLQEAFASGMAVMCGDRFPVNEWLPRDILIPISGYKQEKIAVQFDSAIITPQDIAKSIDSIFERDISEYSLKGLEFNNKNNWKIWKEKYTKLMLQLLEGQDSSALTS